MLAVVLLSLYLAVYPAAAAGLAWRWGRRRRRFASSSSSPPPGSSPNGCARPVHRLRLEPARRGPAGDAGRPGRRAWSAPTACPASPRWPAGALLLLCLAAVALAAGALAAGPSAAGRRPASLAGGGARRPAGPALRIVQPNIGQQDKWREGFERRESGAASKRLSTSAGGEPRLLLWPEAAVTRPLENGLRDPGHVSRDAASFAATSAAMLGAEDLLLTGGVTWRSPDGARRDQRHQQRLRARPDRPDPRPLRQGASRALWRISADAAAPRRRSACRGSRPATSTSIPGPGPRTLDLPVVGKVGFQLCYEIIFSGEVVDRGNRPGFLFNPSNDAWFGAWGPPQHLAQARLRAIEEGLPVLRATPTGICAVIDARRPAARAACPGARPGVIDARLPPPSRRPCSPGSATSCPLLLCAAAGRLRWSRSALQCGAKAARERAYKDIFISDSPSELRKAGSPDAQQLPLHVRIASPKAIPTRSSDQISDAIVDLFLAKDPEARVACETLTTTQRVVLAGEIRWPKGVMDEDGNWAPGVAATRSRQAVRETVKRDRLRAGRLPLGDARLREPPPRPVGAHRAGRRRQRQQGRGRRRPGHHVRLSPATRRPT